MQGRAPDQLHPFLKTRFEDVAMDLAVLQVPLTSPPADLITSRGVSIPSQFHWSFMECIQV